MYICLDFKGVKTKDALHEYLQQELQLPEYYGRNLDALFDCLTDISSDITVTLEHFENLREALDDYADALLKVFLGTCALVNMK